MGRVRRGGRIGGGGGGGGGTYGRHAGGIGLHARNTRLLCFADDFGCDGLVQVQRHQIVDVGLDGLQAVTVLQTLLHRSNRRHQVRLRAWVSIAS